MGKIRKNYIYSVSYQLLVLIAPIVTAPYLARILGADNLGIYSYVTSSGSIITTLSLLGIYSYGNRQTAYVRECRDSLTEAFWEIEFLRLILGIGGTAIYFIYALLNRKYSVFFYIYYPYILAQFIDCSWIYVGLENMKPAVLKNAVTKIANIAGIFIFVKSKDDLWIYIMLLALTTLMANISIYTQLPRYIDGPRINLRALSKHLKGSLALFLPQIATMFYLQMDKVMLEWLTGSTNQISFYDQAEKIVNISLSFVTVISSVVMPRLANEYQKKNTSAVRTLLLRVSKYALCMAAPMMFGMLCVSQQLIEWYLGAEFRATANAIMILSPVILLNTLSGISGNQYFTATNQTGILLKASFTAAVLNVSVNLVLIPKYGYIGAAIATVVSSLASVIIQFRPFMKQIQIKELWHDLLKYVTGSLIMAIIISLLTWKMNATALTTIIQIAAGIVIYALFLLLTKDTVIKEIMVLLRNRRNKFHEI